MSTDLSELTDNEVYEILSRTAPEDRVEVSSQLVYRVDSPGQCYASLATHALDLALPFAKAIVREDMGRKAPWQAAEEGSHVESLREVAGDLANQLLEGVRSGFKSEPTIEDGAVDFFVTRSRYSLAEAIDFIERYQVAVNNISTTGNNITASVGAVAVVDDLLRRDEFASALETLQRFVIDDERDALITAEQRGAIARSQITSGDKTKTARAGQLINPEDGAQITAALLDESVAKYVTPLLEAGDAYLSYKLFEAALRRDKQPEERGLENTIIAALEINGDAARAFVACAVVTIPDSSWALAKDYITDTSPSILAAELDRTRESFRAAFAPASRQPWNLFPESIQKGISGLPGAPAPVTLD